MNINKIIYFHFKKTEQENNLNKKKGMKKLSLQYSGKIILGIFSF